MNLKNLKILIADNDNIPFGEILKILLSMGIKSENITSFSDGLSIYKHSQTISRISAPNIIIAALEMPLMDGIEFTEKAKERDLLKSIPFIMLLPNSSDIEKCKKIKNEINFFVILDKNNWRHGFETAIRNLNGRR